MEKEGISMSEEKKNLTEEERKELKEGLKNQIDEMSDDELDKVAGGRWGGLLPRELPAMVGEMIRFYDIFTPKGGKDCCVSQEFMKSNSDVKVGGIATIDGTDYTIVGTCGNLMGEYADIRIIYYVHGNSYYGISSAPKEKIVKIRQTLS